MIYLDNNATTIMSSEVKKEMVKWCNRGNPSADYVSAKESRDMMDAFKKYLLKSLKLTDYTVIFTSGASESNSMILISAVRAYTKTTGQIPHIIITSWEHKSLLLCALSLQEDKLVELTMIDPQRGIIVPESISMAIKPNTALVCCMVANNETGGITDIISIGKICHKANIPFHSDAVQSINKTTLDYSHCDSISLSFHKVHGPPGVGALMIKTAWLNGWNLQPIIYGTQMSGLRGGTENIMGIAASFVAMKLSEVNRTEKNKEIKRLKTLLINALGEKIPLRSYWKPTGIPKPLEIIIFDTPNDLGNTILLSFVRRPTPLCNQSIKKHLLTAGIVVSVGSACNTTSALTSHVIESIGIKLVDENMAIRKGVIRISLGDETTAGDIKKFVSVVLKYIKV